MPSDGTPCVEKVSQHDSIKIKDVPDNLGYNINLLIEEDLIKTLKDSTTTTQLCSKPILVRVDEIDKEDLEFVGENSQETSNTSHQSKKDKKKEIIVQALNRKV